MSRPRVLVQAWLPDGVLERWKERFPAFEILDGRDPASLDAHLRSAVITYGHPPAEKLSQASALRWIQLTSAGVPQDLCPPAKEQGITVTNLAGLYGPTIAEHALGLMTLLARNLHLVLRNQLQGKWDRTARDTMFDLQGKTLAIVGLGNIGCSIARLARAYGMRVIGCRRKEQACPHVDQLYPRAELHAMLAEADVVAVAAPLTRHSEAMLGPPEFAAMKRGVLYVNVSRGPIAQEQALLDALRSGHVRAAGLDVFAVEPLAEGHPFWSMPQVFVSPHYCGETINLSARPAERFARNFEAWAAGRPLEGVVDLDCGY